MKIAIIGAGISGLTAAWSLFKEHDVTLFEAAGRAGGHTDTHSITLDNQTLAVDSGFIVFNQHNYPHFTRMLRELGVGWQASDMSFSVTHEESGLVYGAEGFGRLFAQRRNLLRPRFYRMLADLLRFYREAPKVLEQADTGESLEGWLRRRRYSEAFIHDHILPMASALWSSPGETAGAFPMRYFVAFMHNHRMLSISGRPQWLTVRGGSQQYVTALLEQLGSRVRLNSPVQSVRRLAHGVEISLAGATLAFDQVIFACHSDQALQLLNDPSVAESDILGNLPYQANEAVLHTDASQMPPIRQAWASWNARVSAHAQEHCSVSYYMNLLQNLPCKTPVIVTLNPARPIPARHVLARRHYAHPVYHAASHLARQRRSEINGHHRTWYCGAYWGFGFHEDGVRSALDVVAALQSRSRQSSLTATRSDQSVAA